MTSVILKALNPNTDLPSRYLESWKDAFDTRIAQELSPGIRILDVGSGRTPAVAKEIRPRDCFYAGLDLSEAELLKAPEGSYDAVYVSDINTPIDRLHREFDLVVSWQVLEHVKDLDVALENMRSYLRDGGRMVVQFSGTFSGFGLANRVIPSGASVWLMKRLLRRDPETVFPAYYHHCWHAAIVKSLSAWRSSQIVARNRGAVYLNFSPLLKKLYLEYENWVDSGEHRNLASHYLVDAQR